MAPEEIVPPIKNRPVTWPLDKPLMADDAADVDGA